MRMGIALGSNLGDRLENLRAARARLRDLHRADGGPFRCAPVYETEPVDCPPDSPAFLNTVVELETELDPLEFLDHAQAIERELGRPERRVRNAPRPVDIDLLYAGDLELQTPVLTIPHPELTRRGFVLFPLARIRPDLVISGQEEPVSVLAEKLERGASGAVLVWEEW